MLFFLLKDQLTTSPERAALAAAKQRGVRLGSYGAETLAPKYRAEAKVRAAQLAPLIRDFQKRGYSMRGIANELKKRRVQTARGGSWHPQLVKRIMQRLDAGRPPDSTWGIRVPTPTIILHIDINTKRLSLWRIFPERRGRC
jgi:hypothetical protein